MKFRSYLKNHAKEEELDRQFQRLHKELFEDYDCSSCQNRCRYLNCTIPFREVARNAEYLGMASEDLIDKYLTEAQFGPACEAKHLPCDFLMEDGNCMLGDCRPDTCKKYSFTDQPERLESLYSVLNTVNVCPVAFEIFERLKQEYHFR